MLFFQQLFGLSYFVWLGIFLLFLFLLYVYFFIKKTVALAEQKQICDGYYDYLYPNELPILWEDELENAKDSEQSESLVQKVRTELNNRKPLPKEAFEAPKKKVLMWKRFFSKVGFRDLTEERLGFLSILLHHERIYLKYNESVFIKFFSQKENKESFPKIVQNYDEFLSSFRRVSLMNGDEMKVIQDRIPEHLWKGIMKNVLDNDSRGQKIVQKTYINNQAIKETESA